MEFRIADTFTDSLERLTGDEQKAVKTTAFDVHSLDAIGLRLFKSHVGQVTLVGRKVLLEIVKKASAAVGGHKFSTRFLTTEWEQVVDARQLGSWEAYRDVARLGRKTRLPEKQREV